jgi:NADH dehydrogenase
LGDPKVIYSVPSVRRGHDNVTNTEKNAREGATPPAGASVVVVGAGFAGGSFLRSLPAPLRRPGETLLMDRREEYAFIPLIHEVAVGRIHPDSARSPIAPDSNALYDILRAEATGVDLENSTLLTSSGPIKYRYLVLAPGSVPIPPPKRLSEYFHTFWSLADALQLRGSLNEAWRSHLLRRDSHPGGLTVAIVGGGATGVELAAEIAVLFDYLKRRSIRTPDEEPRVVLLEATDRLMGWLQPYFHEVAIEELSRLNIEVRLNAPVTVANEDGIEADGEWLPAATRVWATGVLAHPLVKDLPGEHDDSGRISVNAHLALPERPEVYVLGDSGVYEHRRLGPLSPTASVAVQQGPYVARDIGRRLRGVLEKRRPPFELFDRGYVVSLGPGSAVANPLGVKLKGRAAQALYRSILLYYMKSSRGRFLTGMDWAMERALGRVGFS